jgi:hypothetical protein
MGSIDLSLFRKKIKNKQQILSSDFPKNTTESISPLSKYKALGNHMQGNDFTQEKQRVLS